MRKMVFMIVTVSLLAACQKNKETKAVNKDTSADSTLTDNAGSSQDVVESAATIKDAGGTDVSTKENAIEVKEAEPVTVVKVAYASFGDKIIADKAISKDEMIKKYKSLKPGDTINVKFKSNIKGVCQKKGCWMTMELPGGKESFVKFKDYAFFVPLNAADQEAIVSGKAFVSETSVAQLRHYAKDGGKSEAEIAKITEPEFEYKFMADGVLISK